ncbi:MAG: undecaprenyldiphospho-muramoylpentapeptide beta-N-acetylglucosaminyltransferase [Cardiobacteriaceae bacterium]|nr:undecaprenyldiphospho-muramoylpentapeptide beta-N-acetylglucosaminyltransferase [Cardiobacteriaceae bacterium]
MNEEFWKDKKILIAAGGTGGHIYPALAVAKKLQGFGARIHWLGNAAGMEGEKIPAAGFALSDIKITALRGKGIAGFIKLPWKLFAAINRSRRVIREFEPNLILAMGGFVSGPAGIAAKLEKIPLAIHEQNAIFGLTNKHLAKFANLVMLGYEQQNAVLRGKKVLVTGNPVRSDIAAIAAHKTFNPPQKRQMLVLGGSQGAKAINEKIPQALAKLARENLPQVVHQCGKNRREEVLEIYRECGLDEEIGKKIEVCEFIDNIDQIYRDTDFVIARSGASSVAEIASVGLPAVFIPFPFAVDDHQTKNAMAVEAEVLPQNQADAEVLAQKIRAFMLLSEEEFLQKSAKMLAYSSVEALTKIVASLQEMLETVEK